MRNYKISVDGCDDSTVFEKAMTKEQLKFLMSIAIQCNKTSEYGCMPTIKVKRVKSTEEK